MENLDKYFMVIDRNKNILYIPGDNQNINLAITEVGVDKVQSCETMGELVANVKYFTHGKEEK